jgi:hypothetical protein
MIADDRDQDIALGDLVVEHLHEIEPRLDVVHIHEQLLARKSLFQAAK